MSTAEYLNIYYYGEARSVRQYILGLTVAEKSALIETIQAGVANQNSLSNYSFFNNNCTRSLLRLITQTLPHSGRNESTILPFRAPKVLSQMLLSPYPAFEYKNTQTKTPFPYSTQELRFLYERCESETCLERIKASVSAIWGQQGSSLVSRQLLNSLARAAANGSLKHNERTRFFQNLLLKLRN